ncbi:MAG: hypothetical protein KAI02_07615 [Gammaproteobacteria bacterium]|nr:hypothetical protein [Gammaproteobacteria bacterium]
MSGGFVDLRQNQGRMIDESFWPSFTDIMTVVVMIFLIATSILIVKNWELVKELKARIEMEQTISQRLKATTEAQQKISKALLDSQDKRHKISQKLQISLELERQRSATVQKTSKEKASLQELLVQAELDLSLIRLHVIETEKKLKLANTAVNTMQETLKLNNKTHQENVLDYEQHIKQQQVEYDQHVALVEQQHDSLSDDYNILEKKYNKLIKPSRSAVGKHVVEVRYEQLLGKDIIQFRSSGEKDYQMLSKNSLYNTLALLKKKYGQSLYIKIIIPDNSGLSYNDAWTFTLDLLNKYDYYYQN